MTNYRLESVPGRSKAKSGAARIRVQANNGKFLAAKVRGKKDAATLSPTTPYSAAQLRHMRAEFDRCSPWLKEALEHGGELHTLESVWGLLASQQSYLWPLANAAGVVSVADHPQGRVMTVWLAGGRLEEILAADPELADWAKANGCTHFQLMGRAGWIKALKPLGWEKTGVIMKRRL